MSYRRSPQEIKRFVNCVMGRFVARRRSAVEHGVGEQAEMHEIKPEMGDDCGR
jgi:hypothetical protein